MKTPWKLLKITQGGSNQPPLLARFHITLTEYQLDVTDLIQLWREKADRKDIVRRALISDTIIDPSESPDQHQLLLQTLERALENQEGTEVRVLPEEQERTLHISTTCFLAHPLRPLIWSFHLSQELGAVLKNEFIIPSLDSLSSVNLDHASLIRIIREKDHVISRLVDVLQTAGIDMDLVFPGVPRYPSCSQQNLPNAAKGLAEFDESVWRSQRPPTETFSISLQGLEVLMSALKASRNEKVDADSGSKILNQGNGKEISPLTADLSKAKSQEAEYFGSVDAAKYVANTEDYSDDSTESEDDLDGRQQKSDLSERSPKQQPRSEQSTSIEQPPSSEQLPKEQQLSTRYASSKKPKLGVLGGGRSAMVTNLPKTDSRINFVSEAPTAPLATTNTRPRLGILGGKTRPESKNAISDAPEIHAEYGNHLGTEFVTDEEESAQQRADQNRAEQKRQLEPKRAAPIKKKRRF